MNFAVPALKKRTAGGSQGLFLHQRCNASVQKINKKMPEPYENGVIGTKNNTLWESVSDFHGVFRQKARACKGAQAHQ